MNLEKIQQAITRLSPDELTQLREWLREYEGRINSGAPEDSNESIRERLRKLQGSLKGTGALETLTEEKRRERLL